MKRELWDVEFLLKDTHVKYTHLNVLSIHEEGSYTVIIKDTGEVYKWPTAVIFRLRLERRK
jgi:alpha-tubulin suppressor-like RCC1 family protein